MEILIRNRWFRSDIRRRYERLQQGRCAICDQLPVPGDALCLDHDHTSGLTRGLLCTSCNLGLGHFDDDVSRLVAAIDYLQTHNRKELR